MFVCVCSYYMNTNIYVCVCVFIHSVSLSFCILNEEWVYQVQKSRPASRNLSSKEEASVSSLNGCIFVPGCVPPYVISVIYLFLTVTTLFSAHHYSNSTCDFMVMININVSLDLYIESLVVGANFCCGLVAHVAYKLLHCLMSLSLLEHHLKERQLQRKNHLFFC